jgi:TolB protein
LKSVYGHDFGAARNPATAYQEITMSKNRYGFLASLLVVGLLAGCDGSTGPAETGAIEVTVSTSGLNADFDEDGYFLKVGDNLQVQVGTSTNMKFVGFLTGNHLVQLDGLAPNCSTLESSSRSANVSAGQTTVLSFAVSCAPNIGTLRVTTTSSGAGAEGNHYSVVIPGIGTVELDANGTQTFENVRVGPFVMSLKNVPTNCLLEPPPTLNLAYKTTVEVDLLVHCFEVGSIQINASTTGFDLDPDGYAVAITGSSVTRQTAVPVNGTSTVTDLMPGTYALTFQYFESNCLPSISSPHVVTVAENTATLVTLDVSCARSPRIAYVSGVGNEADIRTIKSNGTDDVRLTTEPGSDTDPDWSPDGSRIAFSSDRDGRSGIYLMNADGSGQVRITEAPGNDYRPAWSPDGTRIAFVSNRTGTAEIYVMSAPGTNVVRLTNNDAIDGDPAWSADGSQIAFQSNRDGGSAIWIMNADGSNPHRLTATSLDDQQPAWSPNGLRIAFSRSNGPGTRDIFLVNSDGTHLTQLTTGLMQATDPAWSADGSRLVVADISRDCFGYYSDFYTCDQYIRIYNTDGTRPEPWLIAAIPAFNPAWQR